MSQITKKALSASLKNLLHQKPLSKITISDIAEDCGVSRMTFYYYFSDIYDLVEWTCMEDASRAVAGNKTYGTWQLGFYNIFEAVLENRSFVANVYHSVSREHIEQYLYEVTYGLLADVIEEAAERLGLTVRDEDKRFIADFYKYAFVGLLLAWIRDGMKEEPERIIARLSILIHGDVERALKKYCAYPDGLPPAEPREPLPRPTEPETPEQTDE